MAHHASASASATALKGKCPDSEETATAGTCANGCGFYGSAATGNMCSKCYREHVADTTAASDTVAAETSTSVIVPAASTAPPEKKIATAAAAASSDEASASAVADDTSVPFVKHRASTANRCATCRKKVGLLGFRCRCEGTFCSVHRYSDKHDCGFDYKIAGREQIAKHNPMVVADKMANRI